MFGRWVLLGGFVVAAVIGGSVETARAYWQCPVGVPDPTSGQPNNSGVACYWVEPQQPEYNPGPTAAPDPGPRIPTMYANSYVAVAWHNNADDVWAIWNHRSEAKAKAAALNACNQVMGSGCTIAISSWNNSVAIARQPNGQVWYATESSPKRARKAVMQSCKAAKNDCKLLHTFTAEPLIQPANFTAEQQEILETNPAFDFSQKYFPSNVKRLTEAFPTTPKADTSRGFLAIAWTRLSPQAWPNLVVASGYPTVQEAEKVAIARCQAESQQTCFSFGAIDDRTYPMFAAYLYGDKEVYWYANTTEKSLEKSADDHCREGNVTCKKIGVFDASRSGVSIYPMPQ